MSSWTIAADAVVAHGEPKDVVDRLDADGDGGVEALKCLTTSASASETTAREWSVTSGPPTGCSSGGWRGSGITAALSPPPRWGKVTQRM
jgi:hypothetical protein